MTLAGPGGSLSARLVVVDDEPATVRLLERLLAGWGYSSVVGTSDSAAALDLCRGTEPDLILLDLQMPAPDGFEILEALGSWRAEHVFVPIVVLTGNADRASCERALALGASDLLTKPFKPVEVQLRIANLLEVRRLNLALRAQNATLEEHVRERTAELEEARTETLERLALAAEFRDDDTHEHALRVGRTAALLAARIGRSASEVELIERAAPLHDVGKIAISDTILLKPGPLTPDEFDVVRRHTIIGQQLLSGSRSDVLRLAETIALSHHEQWNGRGYPHRLRRDKIPLAARIVAVADVFDALTHDRPYKAAVPLDYALAEMHMLAGTYFEPRLIEAFASLDHDALLDPMSDRARVHA